MKALVIRQPWAWAVVYAMKPEMRDARLTYRGKLAIVAAKDDDERGYRTVPRILRATRSPLVLPPRDALMRRGVQGVGDLVDCSPARELLDRPHDVRRAWATATPRRFALTFAHMIPIEGLHVYVRGLPGMFDLPESVERILTPIITQHNALKGIQP